MTIHNGPAVVVEGLRKDYGRNTAVQDVSFEVERGEIFGLLGPNGSGKTTTVECIQALRQPTSGKMRVLGLDPQTEPDQVRRHIGSQLQETALPDRIKVWEALRLAATLAQTPGDWEALLEQWGLAEKRNASFHSLSGGQRQRLFVALALVNRPSVVFLDEMTTGLDPNARRVAWDLVRRIRDQGATVVMVTHFMDEAENLCDRIAVLSGGRIVAGGTPQSLVTEHGGEVRLRFSTDAEELPDLEATGVSRISRHGDSVELVAPADRTARVAHVLISGGIDPLDFRVVQPSLEDVYLDIIGSAEDMS
ncbi:MAG: ABC transporter ATP-binding protein [Acidimicrobiia bacterium]